MITSFKLFENVEHDLFIIDSVFIDYEDMQPFKIRGGDGTSYPSVHKVEHKLTKSGNYKSDIYCDYLYTHCIESDVKNDTKERLRRYGFNIISITVKKSDDYIVKNIPIAGKSTFHRKVDPIYIISVLMKKIG